jgi:V8-like Glu-specific endopeptidase
LEPLLTLTGYDTFRNPYKFMTHSGVIYDIRKGAIFYDIDTMGGQSGSPVYLKDNPRKLVGIHKAASNEDRLNFSAMITKEMVEVLKMWSVEMEPYFRVIPKSK